MASQRASDIAARAIANKRSDRVNHGRLAHHLYILLLVLCFPIVLNLGIVVGNASFIVGIVEAVRYVN